MLHVLVLTLDDVSVHELELKWPKAPPSFHDTVLVGEVGELVVSTTFTLNVIGLLRASADGFGRMVVEVLSITVMETVAAALVFVPSVVVNVKLSDPW